MRKNNELKKIESLPALLPQALGLLKQQTGRRLICKDDLAIILFGKNESITVGLSRKGYQQMNEYLMGLPFPEALEIWNSFTMTVKYEILNAWGLDDSQFDFALAKKLGMPLSAANKAFCYRNRENTIFPQKKSVFLTLEEQTTERYVGMLNTLPLSEAVELIEETNVNFLKVLCRYEFLVSCEQAEWSLEGDFALHVRSGLGLPHAMPLMAWLQKNAARIFQEIIFDFGDNSFVEDQQEIRAWEKRQRLFGGTKVYVDAPADGTDVFDDPNVDVDRDMGMEILNNFLDS